MSEIALVPYTEFDADELGLHLSQLVDANRGQLLERHFMGLVDRYGAGPETALASATAGQEHHQNWQTVLESPERSPREYQRDESAHFAIVAGDRTSDTNPDVKKVIGAASLQPGLTLRRLRLPIPPRAADLIPVLAAKPTINDVNNGCNVRAWTDEANDPKARHLTNAYKELAASALWTCSDAIWTIEPRHTALAAIHRAIGSTILRPIANGRFDDEESGRHIPPVSTLYIHRPIIGLIV
jgi:hypothetical protein